MTCLMGNEMETYIEVTIKYHGKDHVVKLDRKLDLASFYSKILSFLPVLEMDVSSPYFVVQIRDGGREVDKKATARSSFALAEQIMMAVCELFAGSYVTFRYGGSAVSLWAPPEMTIAQVEELMYHAHCCERLNGSISVVEGFRGEERRLPNTSPVALLGVIEDITRVNGVVILWSPTLDEASGLGNLGMRDLISRSVSRYGPPSDSLHIHAISRKRRMELTFKDCEITYDNVFYIVQSVYGRMKEEVSR